ncbi:hypothetical protein L1049_025461 [Liquidambar formosana]|uniref:FAR1 domain-containing protein n=1 Tax=Liquidambar formosana TaxID=63359 RepID=A0AAP0NBW3_LIQFO
MDNKPFVGDAEGSNEHDNRPFVGDAEQKVMDTSAFVGYAQGSDEHDGYGELAMDIGLSSEPQNMDQVEFVDGEQCEEPKVGMVFSSEYDVRQFFSKFVEKEGFGIKKCSVKCDQNGVVKYFCLACSRNGKHLSKGKNTLNPRPSVKSGCKAKINIVVRNVCDYVISKVSLIHNHGLSPGKSRHFPSHRIVDPISKRMLEFNDRAGIPLVKSYRALVIRNGGYDCVNFGERDARNFIAESRDSRLGVGDAETVSNYFKRMQKRNPNFYYVLDFDEDGRLRNLFWADARSRAVYESFSNVVSFNTTYLTNRYKMPFALFVGVNHHGVGWNACHSVRQKLLSLISASQFKLELQRFFQIPNTVFVYGT